MKRETQDGLFDSRDHSGNEAAVAHTASVMAATGDTDGASHVKADRIAEATMSTQVAPDYEAEAVITDSGGAERDNAEPMNEGDSGDDGNGEYVSLTAVDGPQSDVEGRSNAGPINIEARLARQGSGSVFIAPMIDGEFSVPLYQIKDWQRGFRIIPDPTRRDYRSLREAVKSPENLTPIVVMAIGNEIVPVDGGLRLGLAQRETSHPNQARRPKHVFSGLGVCGICNGPWTIKTASYWGCATRREGSGCSNNRTISTESYERRVLSGLKERMLDPELVSIFIQEYHAERGRRALVMQRNSAGLQRKVVEATSRIERLVGAIASGASDFSEIRGALEKARTDKAAAIAALADADALPVVALHPTIAADYRRQIAGLQEALARPEAGVEAIPAIRALIDRIVMHPKADGRGVSIEVFGRLAGIIALATGEQPPEALTAKVERAKGIEPSS